MNGELKELLFGNLQGLTRSYQSSVSLMSTYEKELARVEAELASEREARAKLEALVADHAAREALEKLEALEALEARAKSEADHAALVADHAALVADHAALAEALAEALVRQEPEPDTDDDPLSVV